MELDPLAVNGKANAPLAPDWFGYGNQNPTRNIDPSGLVVELYCERIIKSGLLSGVLFLSRHCYVRTACETCGDGFDLTYEIWGPDTEAGFPNGRPVEGFSDPNRNSSWWRTIKVPLTPSGSDDCSLEKCIRQAFLDTYPHLPTYNPTGPNSNTFANNLLQRCGIHAEFPWNAPGAQ
jgi:hypothetical protein